MAIQYTIKAIIQNNTLYVRYIFDRKKTLIRIQKLDSIQVKNFNKDKGVFKNFTDLNSLICQYSDYLERFVKTNFDKSIDNIRKNFLPYFEAETLKEERQTKVISLERHWKEEDDKTDFEFLQMKKELLESELEDTIKRIYAFNIEGHTTEEENKFRHLLEEWVNLSSWNELSDTLKNGVKLLQKDLLEFAEVKKFILNFDNLSTDFYYSFGSYMMHERTPTITNNTFGNKIKLLKRFLRYAAKQHVKINSDFDNWKIYDKEKQVYLLTEEELNLIYDYKEEATEAEVKAIDFIWFHSHCGLRVNDLLSNNFNLNTAKQENIITGENSKNETKFFIPLEFDTTNRSIEILKKYNYNLNLFTLDTFTTTIRKVIEKVFTRNNLHTEKYKIVVEKFKKKEIIEDYFWNLYTSHNNKKYFINNMISKGIAEARVGAMLGNKNSRILNKNYIKAEENDILNELKKRKIN